MAGLDIGPLLRPSPALLRALAGSPHTLDGAPSPSSGQRVLLLPGAEAALLGHPTPISTPELGGGLSSRE